MSKMGQVGGRYGFRSGAGKFKNLEVDNDLTILGDLVFGDTVADSLTVNGILNQGTNATPLSYTEGTPLRTLYATNAGTSGSTSAEPFYVKSVLTGAGQVGGRALFYMTANVALGGWSNALKAEVVYGSSGRTTGLGSAFVAEIALEAGTTSGTYAPLEAEIVMPSGASTGTSTSFLYCNVTGADVSTFDTNGFLFEIGTGITPAAGKFVSANSQTIKCKVEANTRYMVLSQSENGLGIGISGTAISFTQGSPPINMYSTNSSTHASNSVEGFYVETTMTGAGGVGGRGRFYMTTNVALGGWSNALKAEVVYGSSGRTTGLGSAFVAEIALEAGTTSGTYAPLEAEIVMPSGASTGTSTSFLYCNVTGADASTFDTNGFLFEIGAGISQGGGKLFDSTANLTNPQIDHTLKCKIDGGIYYVPLMDNANGS